MKGPRRKAIRLGYMQIQAMERIRSLDKYPTLGGDKSRITGSLLGYEFICADSSTPSGFKLTERDEEFLGRHNARCVSDVIGQLVQIYGARA